VGSAAIPPVAKLEITELLIPEGEYVCFLHEENRPSVMRVRIRDHKVERVADLKNFRQAGFYNVWLGLAPDYSPLLLRDIGTQEIYALDWQAW
jgi:hypothetical protein